MTLRPYTNKEWDTLPHVFLTNELEWDPSVLDHALANDERWYDAISDLEANPTTNLFDEYGNYRKRVDIILIVLKLFGRVEPFPNNAY